jgi:hypothetical protein
VSGTYTGHLRRVDGAVVGEIRDSWGFTIHITATPDPAGGYTLTGTPGDPPPDFWVVAIDGERVG